MKLDFKFDYKKILSTIISTLSRYKIVLTAVVILGVFSFAILRINMLSSPEANLERYNEQLTTLRKVQINTDTVESIQQLKSSGIEIDPSFNNTRDNPFSE